MTNLSLKKLGNSLQKVSCSIVGARGYAGLELAKILLKHPAVDLKVCFATSDFSLSDYLINADQVKCLNDKMLFENLTDVIFLATPAEVSLALAPKIIAAGKKVIDLSGAFRLKTNDYSNWYGFEHTEKNLLQGARYGLSPWCGPAKDEKLIANPGCFATAITMALLPLVKEKVIDLDHVVIDAKSGSTGGGKKASENLLFTEVDGECLPYKVGRHQHQPEIEETIALFAGEKIDAHFVTSLLAARRGITAGIYGRFAKGKALKDVTEAFEKAYADYPLVSFAKIGEGPTLLPLKKVVGTARTHISYEIQGEKLFVFSNIDNLMKGAASQAVENLNVLLDIPVQTGLTEWEAMI